MKIKKFKARTFSEALELVKKELSEDAVILSTEEISGLRPGVVVTAAMDYDAAGHSAQHTQAAQARLEDAGPVPGPCAEPSPKDSPSEIKAEIENLRRAIEEMKNIGYEMALPREKRAAFNFLKERAVRDEYALRLCENVKSLEDIPLLISADIRVRGIAQTKKAVMFIGPTGVGKTTTIAKLAAQAVKSGKKAGIINLDTYRIGAVEQVRIYSRILGIPLMIATNASELEASLVKLSTTRDIVFIDTTGRNPRDEKFILETASLMKTGVPIELHLLMSASSDDAFMIEAYRYYKRLPIDYIAFSKLDEAVRFGTLYNLILTYQKPVSYITTGQRVPGDIELATVNRLAGLIVRKREPDNTPRGVSASL